MGSILIGVKRFFQNKNTVTIFAIVLSLGILYWAYSYRIKRATDPVSVPYATQMIGPRTLITNDMVSTKKVPGGIVRNGALTNINDIVGKYVSNKAVIPEGSLFYSSMVLNWEDLPSSEFEDIKECHTIYGLNVNSDSTFGNSIYPGNCIDLYYRSYEVKNGKQVMYLGKFIESIEVLSVIDGAGKNVFETSGAPGSPSKLLFSVPDKIFTLLTIAERSGGEIFPVQRNANYSKNCKNTKAKVSSTQISEKIMNYAIPAETEYLIKSLDSGRCSE